MGDYPPSRPCVVGLPEPDQRQTGQELAYSAFLDEVEKGRVERVTVTGSEIHGTFRDTQQGFVTLGPIDTRLIERLREKNVTTAFRSPNADSPWYMGFLLNWLPIIAFIAIWIYMSRQMQNGAGARWASANPARGC